MEKIEKAGERKTAEVWERVFLSRLSPVFLALARPLFRLSPLTESLAQVMQRYSIIVTPRYCITSSFNIVTAWRSSRFLSSVIEWSNVKSSSSLRLLRPTEMFRYRWRRTRAAAFGCLWRVRIPFLFPTIRFISRNERKYLEQ